MDENQPEGGSEIAAAAGTQVTAAAELETRVEQVLARVRALAGDASPTDFEALRTEVLELARSHAARAVLEAVTARLAARDQAAQRRRRPGRRW